MNINDHIASYPPMPAQNVAQTQILEFHSRSTCEPYKNSTVNYSSNLLVQLHKLE